MQNESPFLGLHTVIYGVDDLDKAKNWYTQMLEIEPYFDKPYYVGFNIRGYELGLDPSIKPIGSANMGVVAYWGVADIEAEFSRLISLGAKEHEKIKDVGDNIKVATVFDPFGNIFGLIYNPHNK